MEKFNRKLEAIDYQIAFFTTFGLNGAEVAKQLGKNKSTINRRLHNNLLIAEINFRRNQLLSYWSNINERYLLYILCPLQQVGVTVVSTTNKN